MNKKSLSMILVFLLIVVLVAVCIWAYFVFFSGCPDGELYDPYNKVCVSENILCSLDRECMLLVGQTGSVDSGALKFRLVSAEEVGNGYDKASIYIEGEGQVNLDNQNNFIYSTRGYDIVFEASDGDKDILMGADFTPQKSVVLD